MDLDFQDPRGYLLSGFLSKHLGSGAQQFNEDNSGLGYMTPDRLMFGMYRNSLNKPSAYLAKELTKGLSGLSDDEKIKAGLIAGLVSGYGKPVLPVLMPELMYSTPEREVALGLVPPIKGVTPATLALQLRKRF
jgi:hypothetical protein